MQDSFFIDTNILVYFVSNDSVKMNICRDLLINDTRSIISSQVINEFTNVVIRKKILSFKNAVSYANDFMAAFNFVLIKKNTIRLSFDIIKKYKFSTWDSLIIASALENDCNILYTEDMQHDQIIEDQLRIINPFKDI